MGVALKNGAKQRRARRHRAVIEIATMIHRKVRDVMNEQIEDFESAMVKASELYGYFLDVPIWYPTKGNEQ